MPARKIGMTWADLPRRWLVVTAAAIVYAALVASGKLLTVEPAGFPFMLPSFGLLCALLVLTARSLWPWIVACAAGIEVAVCQTLSPDWAWIDRIAIIGALLCLAVGVAHHASFGLTALARRSQGSLVSTRIAKAIFSGAVLIFPFAWAWDAWRDLPYLDPVSFTTAVFLGFAVTTPLALVLRYPLVGPSGRDATRTAQTVVSTAAMVLLAGLPLLPIPDAAVETLAEYHHVLLLSGVLIAMSLASRADPRLTAGVLIVVAFVFAAGLNVEARLMTPGVTMTSAELFAEQAYVVLLFTVGFWMAILMSETRRRHAARRIREQIADDVLRTSDEINTGVVDLARERLDAALARVGQFARAAECRLYALDGTDRVATLEHQWRETPLPPGAEPAPAFVGFHRISWIVNELQAGNDVRSGDDADRDRALNAAAPALAISATDRVWMRPILLGDEVVGVVGLFEPATRLDWRYDVGDLLTVVGDFFAELVQRERALNNMRNYERDLRKLASHVAQAEERTRRQTAVSLHDGLGQTLAVARMKLREMQSKRPDDEDRLEVLLDIVDSALVTTRHLINALNPTVLYELGLMPALETLRDTVDATSPFDVTLEESGERLELDESASRVVYEAARELVSNAVRHSGGEHIWIDVHWQDDQHLECRVSDDGVGIAQQEDISRMPASRRYGLFLTRERLSGVHGELSLQERSAGGTCAIIRIDAAAKDGDA